MKRTFGILRHLVNRNRRKLCTLVFRRIVQVPKRNHAAPIPVMQNKLVALRMIRTKRRRKLCLYLGNLALSQRRVILASQHGAHIAETHRTPSLEHLDQLDAQ